MLCAPMLFHFVDANIVISAIWSCTMKVLVPKVMNCVVVALPLSLAREEFLTRSDAT